MNQQAIEEYKSGTPVPDILSKYFISKTTFYRWLKKIDIDKRGPIERFTLNQIQEIVSKYENGTSLKELMKEYNTSHTALSKIIPNKRTISEVVIKFSEEQIDEMIESYQSGMSAYEAGKLIGMSKHSALRYLKDKSIERRTRDDQYIEMNIFDKLDSEEKLYWFGFLTADARIVRKKLEINLGLKDKHHLYMFMEFMGGLGRIDEVTVNHTKTKKTYVHASYKLYRINVARDLRKHGIIEIKNGNPSPLEKLNDEQLRIFIRGFFDGDGSIHYKRKNLSWYICGEFKETIEYMMSRCPVVDRHNATGSEKKWRVVYGGNRIVPRICKWLYKDSAISLSRKEKIYHGVSGTTFTTFKWAQ